MSGMSTDNDINFPFRPDISHFYEKPALSPLPVDKNNLEIGFAKGLLGIKA